MMERVRRARNKEQVIVINQISHFNSSHFLFKRDKFYFPIIYDIKMIFTFMS